MRVVPAAQALPAQLAAFAGGESASSFLELRCLRAGGEVGPRRFFPVSELRKAAAWALTREDLHVYVGAAPRVRERGRAQDVERAWALWVDCDSPESVAALRRFDPLPSIVWETSPGRLQALWPLREPVAAEEARRFNRRLARGIGSDPAATDPARVLRAIGSLNIKYDPAAPVQCRRAELDWCVAADVVGSLPEEVVEPRFSPPVPMPSSASLDGLVRTVRDAPVGNRNRALFWSAKRLADRDDQCDGRELLRQAALDAGLPEGEVEATLASALDRRVAA